MENTKRILSRFEIILRNLQMDGIGMPGLGTESVLGGGPLRLGGGGGGRFGLRGGVWLGGELGI